MPLSTILQKCYHSLYPVLNIHHHNEPVTTNTAFLDTPAIDGGATMAHIFVGTESLLTNIEEMKTQISNKVTLEDNIHQQNAPNRLISDHAQVEISNKVKDILRAL